MAHNGIWQVRDRVAGADDREEGVALLAEDSRAEPERFAEPPTVLEERAPERHVRADADAAEVRHLEPLGSRTIDAKGDLPEILPAGGCVPSGCWRVERGRQNPPCRPE